MDWTTLTAAKGTAGALADWVSSSQIQNSAATIIQEAESEIYRRLRHWQMISAPTTGTMTAGNDYVALPAQFLEPITFWITGVNQMEIIQKPIQEVLAAWSYDGSGNRIQQQPCIYYFDSAAFRFDSQADQAYPYAVTYYAQPLPLSSSNTTNWVTNTYPRMFRAALMMQACEWIKDAGQDGMTKEYWAQLLQDEIAKAQEESDRSRRGVIAGTVFAGEYNNMARW